MRLFTPLLTLALALSVSTGHAATFNVSSAEDITNALQNAKPGDELVMQDGTWTDQEIHFASNGSADAPLTLRAQTPGKVILTGTSELQISGRHLVIDGLHFKDGTVDTSEHVVQFRGANGDAHNCRLTNSVIESYNPPDPKDRYFWVSLYGENNRVDHNTFLNHDHSGVTVVVWLDGKPVNHRIDGNHFADRPAGDGNGYETLRIGTSKQSHTDAHVVVENNLFERVDGEIEIISGKSNDNIYRYNTFRACAGTLTLRHGHRSTVEGNFFLGQNKHESGGVRVIGEDHIVVNNYFEAVDDRADGAVSITAGIPNTPANGYQQVKNAVVAFNTFVDLDGPAITLDWGYGGRNRTLLPEDVTIAGNLIVGGTADGQFEGKEGSGFTWSHNIAFGAPLGIPARRGIAEVNPRLRRGADGLSRPVPSSPAVDAIPATPIVTTDIDGQPRTARFDVGADELSDAAVVRGPLTDDDAGAVWFDYKPRNGK